MNTLLEDLRGLLTQIKDKIKTCENTTEQNKYLEEYKNYPEISKIEDLLQKFKYSDIECNF
jgi:hypothetical protein